MISHRHLSVLNQVLAVHGQATANDLLAVQPRLQVSQNPVETGGTEVRGKGHVSTSRPPKSHIVDQCHIAELLERHTQTALCEISLQHPERRTISSFTKHDALRHPGRPRTSS